MTYASPLDIREGVAPDGNTTGTCAEMTDDQLQRHITRAQQLVDAYTGTVFTDNNVPVLLSGLVLALGTYYATLAYRKGLALEPTHPVALQYADAKSTLAAIKTGILKFEPAAPDTDLPPVRPKPLVINAGPLNAAPMFLLDDVGLTIQCSDDRGPTIDPALFDPGLWGGT